MIGCKSYSNLLSPWRLRDDFPAICSGIFSSNEDEVLSNTAVEGYCPSNCQQQFFLLMLVGVILGSMASTGLLPSTLINMRAIRKTDKSASITLSVSALSAFAILPSPIIFGAIYDSSFVYKHQIQFECGGLNTF